ncbi:hypothetical protein C8F01DRAFT_1146736 [Mycena amicta]|nr:hypothetical protein C8F01DRAFT_1146736 [Mycena amicta]
MPGLHVLRVAGIVTAGECRSIELEYGGQKVSDGVSRQLVRGLNGRAVGGKCEHSLPTHDGRGMKGPATGDDCRHALVFLHACLWRKKSANRRRNRGTLTSADRSRDTCPPASRLLVPHRDRVLWVDVGYVLFTGLGILAQVDSAAGLRRVEGSLKVAT